MKLKIKKINVKSDSRGWLSEIIRPEDVKNAQFGQLILTIAYPAEVRGNHYHKRKTEWYCVISGKAILTIISTKTREKKEIIMGEDKFVLVEIPPNHFHSIKNVGEKEMMLLAYVDESFNSIDADTYS